MKIYACVIHDVIDQVQMCVKLGSPNSWSFSTLEKVTKPHDMIWYDMIGLIKFYFKASLLVIKVGVKSQNVGRSTIFPKLCKKV